MRASLSTPNAIESTYRTGLGRPLRFPRVVALRIPRGVRGVEWGQRSARAQAQIRTTLDPASAEDGISTRGQGLSSTGFALRPDSQKPRVS